MRRRMTWILSVAAASAVIHVITVMYLPTGILIALSLSKKSKGPNRIVHSPPITAESREVVRPSPDILYSICAYDVRKAPLKITAPVPDSYWSMSIYSSKTDNFFVLNDRDVPQGMADVVLVNRGMEHQSGPGEVVVTAPTNRGAILFRILIEDEKKKQELIDIQKKADCRPILKNKDQ